MKPHLLHRCRRRFRRREPEGMTVMKEHLCARNAYETTFQSQLSSAVSCGSLTGVCGVCGAE